MWQAVRDSEREVKAILAGREKQEQSVTLVTPYTDITRERRADTDDEEEAADAAAPDYLASFLPSGFAASSRPLTVKEALDTRAECLRVCLSHAPHSPLLSHAPFTSMTQLKKSYHRIHGLKYLTGFSSRSVHVTDRVAKALWVEMKSRQTLFVSRHAQTHNRLVDSNVGLYIFGRKPLSLVSSQASTSESFIM
jgi:hypothetical protein